jgi:hypothetical protein
MVLLITHIFAIIEEQTRSKDQRPWGLVGYEVLVHFIKGVERVFYIPVLEKTRCYHNFWGSLGTDCNYWLLRTQWELYQIHEGWTVTCWRSWNQGLYSSGSSGVQSRYRSVSALFCETAALFGLFLHAFFRTKAHRRVVSTLVVGRRVTERTLLCSNEVSTPSRIWGFFFVCEPVPVENCNSWSLASSLFRKALRDKSLSTSSKKTNLLWLRVVKTWHSQYKVW